MPDIEHQHTLNIDTNVISETRILSRLNNAPEIIQFRNELMHEFGLDNINNLSTNAEIDRYNHFVDTWNKSIRGSVREVMLTKIVETPCEALVRELRNENAILRAENAELRRENAILRAENAELRRENAELKAENIELRNRIERLEIIVARFA
jgi:FtsZ-binding cell division protein ZapB